MLYDWSTPTFPREVRSVESVLAVMVALRMNEALRCPEWMEAYDSFVIGPRAGIVEPLRVTAPPRPSLSESLSRLGKERVSI